MRHEPDKRLRAIAVAAAGRRAEAALRAAAPLPPGKRVCASCPNVAVKHKALCRGCAAKAAAVVILGPCAARWFAWSPLAGWPRAMPIAPWVVASPGADRVVFA